MHGLSPVAASGDHSSSRCAGLSLSRPLLLRSTGSRRTGSVVVAHGPSCSVACGIFPDQGSNPCPLHWQADSQPLRHQGSPVVHFICNSLDLCLCIAPRRLPWGLVRVAQVPLAPLLHLLSLFPFWSFCQSLSIIHLEQNLSLFDA